MKREEVKEKIPGITDEQLDWVMGEFGTAVNTANTLRAELGTANQTIQTLQEAARSFEGVDVGALQSELSTLQQKYRDDLAAVRRDGAIDLALSAARAKSTKAARAMLDLEQIKLEDGRLSGLDGQLEQLKAENPWLFEEAASGGMQVRTGGEHGAGGTGEQSGVAAAFAALNPGLKIE